MRDWRGPSRCDERSALGLEVAGRDEAGFDQTEIADVEHPAMLVWLTSSRRAYMAAAASLTQVSTRPKVSTAWSAGARRHRPRRCRARRAGLTALVADRRPRLRRALRRCGPRGPPWRRRLRARRAVASPIPLDASIDDHDLLGQRLPALTFHSPDLTKGRAPERPLHISNVEGAVRLRKRPSRPWPDRCRSLVEPGVAVDTRLGDAGPGAGSSPWRSPGCHRFRRRRCRCWQACRPRRCWACARSSSRRGRRCRCRRCRQDRSNCRAPSLAVLARFGDGCLRRAKKKRRLRLRRWRIRRRWVLFLANGRSRIELPDRAEAAYPVRLRLPLRWGSWWSRPCLCSPRKTLRISPGHQRAARDQSLRRFAVPDPPRRDVPERAPPASTGARLLPRVASAGSRRSTPDTRPAPRR